MNETIPVNRSELITFVIIGFLFGLAIGFFLGSLWAVSPAVTEEVFELDFTKGLGSIYGSGSMSPLIDKDVYPNMTYAYREVNLSEDLVIGKLYTYSKENQTRDVLHALYDIQWINGEEILFFKGYANQRFDKPVRRPQIVQEVTAIFYEDISDK